MIFIVTLCGLLLTALILFNRAKKIVPIPKNAQFDRLQRNYLSVYFLATFSDWLQGPYVYKLYSDYGYKEEDIAILYITGFASSFLFGAIIGHLADKYGRKLFCVSFGFIYSLCCLTKLSTEFYMLMIGRVLGGISTSILFSTFEAWYINEHINHLNLPVEWLNITFSKATFYTGLLAILAGIISQIFVESLGLGSLSPFILAIPFLVSSSYLIMNTWKEHFYSRPSSHQSIFAPLYLIFIKDRMLLILGLIQSLFEAVMYTFIFSWTPIISELNPPLGIVFSCFMLAYMIGSKIYSLNLSDRLPPQLNLVLLCGTAFMSFLIVGLIMFYIIYDNSLSLEARTSLIQVCFICFVLYEGGVGLYVPVMGYLKGRVVPEEYRVSISNWFRVPMNLFTCISLSFDQINEVDTSGFSPSVIVFKKFHLIYFLCSIFLLFTTLASIAFQKKYTRRFSKEESFSESSNIVMDDHVNDKSALSKDLSDG